MESRGAFWVIGPYIMRWWYNTFINSFATPGTRRSCLNIFKGFERRIYPNDVSENIEFLWGRGGYNYDPLGLHFKEENLSFFLIAIESKWECWFIFWKIVPSQLIRVNFDQTLLQPPGINFFYFRKLKVLFGTKIQWIQGNRSDNVFPFPQRDYKRELLKETWRQTFHPLKG